MSEWDNIKYDLAHPLAEAEYRLALRKAVWGLRKQTGRNVSRNQAHEEALCDHLDQVERDKLIKTETQIQLAEAVSEERKAKWTRMASTYAITGCAMFYAASQNFPALFVAVMCVVINVAVHVYQHSQRRRHWTGTGIDAKEIERMAE